jgi:glutaredoxin
MGKVILYEHGCPNCKRLKGRLDAYGINYKTVNDIKVMQDKGFTSAPKLEVDGVILSFKQAMDWAEENKTNG